MVDVEKLLAAITEREQMAKRTEPGPWAAWSSDMPGEFVVARRNEQTGKPDPDRVATTGGLHCAEQNARFIADNDPAAVLRRCAAERTMVDVCRAAERRFECGDGDALGEATLAMMVLVHLHEAYGLPVSSV
jgi:hypothetical protein